MPVLNGPDNFNNQFSVAADGTISLTTPPFSAAGGTIKPGPVIINANAAAPAAPAAGTLLQVTAADGQPSKITVNSLAAAPAYEMRYAGGTLAAPSAPPGAAFLGAINQFAWNGSSYAVAGQIAVISTEAWTGTANGSAVLFSTVANGTTALTERVRIDNNGNVGIGTTAPANKLTVQSATQFDGITVRNATNFIASLAGLAAGTNDGGVLQLLNAGTPQVYLSATSNSYLNGGSVGIGTATPIGKLTLSGAGQGTGSLNTTGALTNALVLDDTGTAVGSGGVILFTAASRAWRFASIIGNVTDAGGNTSGDILFSTRLHIADGALTEVARITSAGNLGVGTPVTNGRITMSGQGQMTPAINTANIGGSLLLDDYSAGVNSGGSIVFSANNQSWRFASIQGIVTSGTNYTTGHISFSTRRTNNDTVLTESMRITDMGTCLNTSGSWSTLSDASVKQDVAPYTRGLDAIVALKPVQFRYAAGMLFTPADKPSRILFGLIADEVKPHVPEIVGTTTATIGKKEGVELSTLEPGNLIYALINAVKELNGKVAALESATVH